MYVRTLAGDGMTRENSCDLRRIYPWQGVVVPPWNSSIVSIRPSESSVTHAHETDETFIFTSGTGTIDIDGDSRAVDKGDVVYIPHRQMHTVTNTGDKALEFVSIYWLQPAAGAQ
jgi:oxalate decarboxylase/phosphoglucose isomerase-like protein (cupin superfamily)